MGEALIEKLKHARRVSVPLVAINTPEPGATIRVVAKTFEGVPIVQWDVCRGVTAVNNEGIPVAQMTGDGEEDITIGQPPMVMVKAADYPEETILLIHNATAYLESPVVQQGVWNLRDQFKADRRMVILLSGDVDLPACLRDDVVVLDEPLPTSAELAEIVAELDNSREIPMLTDQVRADAVEAVRGLNSFAAEQAVAMAMRKHGIDLDHLWSSKIREIEQTRGLSVHRGGGKFQDLGGLEPLKQYLGAVMTGRRKINLVVWLDEVEKTGLANRQDTSGVNQDQEGTLLQFLEDHQHYGVMLLGAPGTGKSAMCKAVGAEFGTVVIRIDLGAMQGSLVGESQRQLRAALRVIEAIGGDDVLWLATSNSIDGLSGAMRSRFTDVFFFDLPTAEERRSIWNVWMAKKGLVDDKPYPKDEGWVGRNIRQCCEKAWMLNKPIAEVAAYITPVAVVEREELERLRSGADSRYLSAQQPGVYRKAEKVRGRARLSLN